MAYIQLFTSFIRSMNPSIGFTLERIVAGANLKKSYELGKLICFRTPNQCLIENQLPAYHIRGKRLNVVRSMTI